MLDMSESSCSTRSDEGGSLHQKGDSEWQPILLRVRLPAISEWYQADWKCATARGSERSSAYSTARKSVPCIWFSPWASLGMISTRLIIMSYQYMTWSTLRAFQQVNNTCRISLQKGNVVHYTRYTIYDSTVTEERYLITLKFSFLFALAMLGNNPKYDKLRYVM